MKFYFYDPSRNSIELNQTNTDVSKNPIYHYQGLYEDPITKENIPVYSTEPVLSTGTIRNEFGTGRTIETKTTPFEETTTTTQAPITETRYYNEAGEEVHQKTGVKYEQMQEIIKTQTPVKIQDLSQGYGKTIDWKSERFQGEYKSNPNKYLAVKVNNLTLVQEPGESGSSFSDRAQNAINTQGQGVQGSYGVMQPLEKQELKSTFGISTEVPKQKTFLFERPSLIVKGLGGTPEAQSFTETFENVGESMFNIGTQPGAYSLSPALIKLHQGKEEVTLFNPLKPSELSTSFEEPGRKAGAFAAYASMIVYPSMPKWARMQEESLVGMTIQNKQLKPGLYEQRIITKGTSEFGTNIKGVSVQQIKTGDSGISWIREFGKYGDSSHVGLGLDFDFSKGSLWKNEFSVTSQSSKDVLDFFYTKGIGTSSEKLNLFGGSGTFGKITSTGLERTGSYGYLGRNVDDFSGLFKTSREVLSSGNVIGIESRGSGTSTLMKQGSNTKQLYQLSQVEGFSSKVLNKATQDITSLSQSELLSKSVTGVASKTGSILTASTLVKPRTSRVSASILTPSTLIKGKTDVAIALIPVEKQKIYSKSSLIQAQRQESKTRSLTSTAQLLKQEQRTSTASMFSTTTGTKQDIITNTITSPFTSNPSIIITGGGGSGGFGGLPFFGGGGGGGRSGRSFFKRSPRAKKYEPSFRSAMFGIKGKAGQANKMYSGYEARPIPESRKDSIYKKSSVKMKGLIFKKSKLFKTKKWRR